MEEGLTDSKNLVLLEEDLESLRDVSAFKRTWNGGMLPNQKWKQNNIETYKKRSRYSVQQVRMNPDFPVQALRRTMQKKKGTKAKNEAFA